MEEDEEHDDVDDQEEEGQGGEVRRSKLVTNVLQPTQKERDAHRPTHIPFRPWCRFCVFGRGRDRQHRTIDRSEDGVPIIGVDFFFIGEPGMKGTIPGVVARDSISKSLFGHIIPGKGTGHGTTADQLASDIDSLGYKRVTIRSDNEPAIVALVRTVKQQ